LSKPKFQVVIAAAALVGGPVLLRNLWPIVGRVSFVHLLATAICCVALAVWLAGQLLAGLTAKIQRRPTTFGNLKGTILLLVEIPLVFCSAVALSRVLPRSLPTGSGLRAFERSSWIAGASEQSNWGDSYTDQKTSTRQAMLADLVRHFLAGKSKAEIEEALGPSLETPYFREAGRDLIYRTGWERDAPWPVDSEWLLIWLDEQGTFLRYEVVTD